ncbi:N-glycosylase/DNA lyase [Candidatus Woesearchaeota archaeon]|nr:MAG: N-glycosylase/DNA lyase [Candidatus Woesearchaeota archaeon]
MSGLAETISELRNSSVKHKVESRLKEFESFAKKETDEWFSELCFCILTANSKAVTALNIQQELTSKGFCGYCQKDLSETIKRNKHRFHNNKAKFIVDARCHVDIKDKIRRIITEMGEFEAREWLVKNIKGLGYKEASHFLRNVGYKNFAILDRHIISLMRENGVIKESPKNLSKKKYLELEKKFNKLAAQLNMSPAELDLYMWYMKTGEVLK